MEAVGHQSIPSASAQPLLAFWSFWRWCVECNQMWLRRGGSVFLKQRLKAVTTGQETLRSLSLNWVWAKELCFWGSAAKQLFCHCRTWKSVQYGGPRLVCMLCVRWIWPLRFSPTCQSDVLLESKKRMGWSVNGCVLTRLNSWILSSVFRHQYLYLVGN